VKAEMVRFTQEPVVDQSHDHGIDREVCADSRIENGIGRFGPGQDSTRDEHNDVRVTRLIRQIGEVGSRCEGSLR